MSSDPAKASTRMPDLTGWSSLGLRLGDKGLHSARRLSQMVTVVDLAQRKIVFTEPGLDAAWAPDGERIIYEDLHAVGTESASGIVFQILSREMWHPRRWEITSAGEDGRQNLILTIDGQFYYLDGDRAVLPATAIKPCDGIGVGERPCFPRMDDKSPLSCTARSSCAT